MGCSVFFRSAKVQTFCRNCNSKENALSYRLLTPTAKHVSVAAVCAHGRTSRASREARQWRRVPRTSRRTYTGGCRRRPSPKAAGGRLRGRTASGGRQRSNSCLLFAMSSYANHNRLFVGVREKHLIKCFIIFKFIRFDVFVFRNSNRLCRICNYIRCKDNRPCELVD